MGIRFDVGTIGKLQRTPQGGVIAPAFLTRTGVFKYLRNGVEIREYRPPEEVFKPESLATLRNAPVTDLHPPELVNPSNWSTYSKGTVVGEGRREGDLLSADLAIQDAGLIAKVDAAEGKEISCGYSVREDETPGTSPEGEDYDIVQRDIVYNHVAIGPSNWGRAGSRASLRLDSADAVQVHGNQKTERIDMGKETIDGVEYEIGSDAWKQAKAKQEKARQDAADAQAQRIKDLEAERDREKGRADANETKSAEAEKVLKKQRRDSIERKARRVLGSGYKADAGIDPEEIMLAAIKKKMPNFDPAGKSPDYIAGVFEALIGGSPDEAPEAALDGGDVPPGDEQQPPPAEKQDSFAWGAKPRLDSPNPRERMLARNAAAAKVPAR